MRAARQQIDWDRGPEGYPAFAPREKRASDLPAFERGEHCGIRRFLALAGTAWMAGRQGVVHSGPEVRRT